MNSKFAILLTLISWALFLMILLTLIVPNAHVRFYEKECTIQSFYTDARFAPHTECTKEDAVDLDDCQSIEDMTLSKYFPKLCLLSKYGSKDLICPSPTPCDGGKKWFTEHSLCTIHFPLAYNVSVDYLVDGKSVSVNRDLDDEAKYKKYRDYYIIGETRTCQIVKKDGNIVWIDELMVAGALEWWKWLLFSMTLFLALVVTVVITISCLRTGHSVSYEPLLTLDEN